LASAGSAIYIERRLQAAAPQTARPDSPAEAVLPADLVAFLQRVWPRGPVPEKQSVKEAL